MDLDNEQNSLKDAENGGETDQNGKLDEIILPSLK
jgi:hypothetical protein